MWRRRSSGGVKRERHFVFDRGQKKARLSARDARYTQEVISHQLFIGANIHGDHFQ